MRSGRWPAGVGAARGDQGPYPPPQAPHHPDRPELVATFGIGFDSAAELLCAAGDNAGRVRSEAAYAKLCGACPVPASSGKTSRHRLNRGGNRQANAALFRIVVVRMRRHPATIAYVQRRTAEGLSKREIIRCLKR
jgi:transposase